MLTTIPARDGQGNPIDEIVARNDAGQYSRTSAAVDGNGAYLAVAEDASVQELVALMGTANSFLGSGATASNQLTANATLLAIKAAIQTQVDLANSIWTDSSGAFYVRRDVVDEADGAITVSFTDPLGNPATPGNGLKPASSVGAIVEQYSYDVTLAGVGISVGDVVVRSVIVNQTTTPPTIVATAWINLTTGAVLTTAPSSSAITATTKDMVVAASALPANAAQETGGNLAATVAALGVDGTSPPTFAGGSTGVRGWLRYIGSLLSGTLTAALAAGSNSVGSVSMTGSAGTDFSTNVGTLPNIGGTVGTTTFGGSGPYAGYTLIKVVAASQRNNIDIENISGAQIAVLRDDGTAGNGSPPSNGTVFALGGGASAGAQGGSWSSATFKGRIQIYAPSAAALVAVMVD